MDPFEDLSSDNHDQIRKYLRFFRQKKDGIIREIDREFIDIRNDKLEETMFTKDDMLDYSDFVASAIKVNILIVLFILEINIIFICFLSPVDSCEC